MLRQHPSSTLFPYTTLFRSIAEERREAGPLRKDSREGALPVEGEQRFAHDERASEGAERQRFVRDREPERLARHVDGERVTIHAEQATLGDQAAGTFPCVAVRCSVR